MNVAFLTNTLEMGGIERNLVLLAEELHRRGHHVVVASRPGSLLPLLLKTGATHVPLHVRLADPRACRADVRALRRLLREGGPDVAHVFSASLAVLLRAANVPLVRRARDGRAVPVVASIMGLVNAPDESKARIQARNLATTVGAQKILLISPAIEEHVRRLPVADARLLRQHVVGVKLPEARLRTPEARRATRRELGLGEQAAMIVTIGGLAPRKSHELFIDGMARVVAKRADAQGFILGEGPLRAELQRKIERDGLANHVHLLGEKQDVMPYLAAADVCVRPGIVEGFIGITVLEAQALEVPVVAFETEDVKLAVRHEETGLLVPPSDTDALAGAILRLLEDPAEAERLAKAGRRLVEREFAIPAVVDGLERLYDAEARKGA